MTGNTASFASAIYQMPLFNSLSLISRLNIPTSALPESASVRPLPAPPGCILNIMSVVDFLYSSLHFKFNGYKANAPEKLICLELFETWLQLMETQ